MHLLHQAWGEARSSLHAGTNCSLEQVLKKGMQKFRFDTEFKGMGAAEKQSATRMESVAHHAQKTEVLILIITEPKLRQNPCPFAECSSYYSKRPH